MKMCCPPISRSARYVSGLVLALLGIMLWRASQQAIVDRKLIAAIHANNPTMVRSLLAQKADPNAQKLLYYELFLDRIHGNKARKTSAPTALVIAMYMVEGPKYSDSSAQNTEIIKALLEEGADANVHYRDGDTPLMIAVWEKPTVVRMLLERGADVRARNTFGATALMKAAGTGDLNMISLLVDKGADIDAKDNYGCNAVRFAIVYGQAKSVKRLIESKIDVNSRDNAGETALTAATQSSQPQIAVLLQHAGAKE